jgi:hypothetical protein
MGEWAAEAIRRHLKEYPPTPCTLPWEKPTGKPRVYKILFRWTTGGHVKSDLFRLLVWKPALVKVGIIPAPTKGPRGRLNYATTRKEGTHQLRHFYASVTLADGVSIKELAEYLGHKDPGFTLRTYAHMLPSSHQRARNAIDTRMTSHSANSDGADTEQGPSSTNPNLPRTRLCPTQKTSRGHIHAGQRLPDRQPGDGPPDHQALDFGRALEDGEVLRRADSPPGPLS